MDVRLLAFLFAVGGVLAAIFCPTQILLVITGIVAVIIIFAVGCLSGSARGTSGEMGAFLLFVGGGLCLLVPMWIIWLIVH